MEGNRSSPEQIIYTLKQVESGVQAVEIRRTMGMREAMFYNSKKR